jgi:hypothetical protein
MENTAQIQLERTGNEAENQGFQMRDYPYMSLALIAFALTLTIIPLAIRSKKTAK